MRLLLDTHILLWILEGRVMPKVNEALRRANAVYVSHASLWEIEIKKSLGRLRLLQDLYTVLPQTGVIFLPVSLQHIRHICSLPHHHGDPFDRMLIAQAQIEELTLVTDDKNIRLYKVALL